MARATDAADAIRKAAKLYENFVIAADILEQIGSLENAQVEAKKALEQYQLARDAEVKALAEAKEATKKAKEQATDIVKDAESKALTIEIGAKAEADKVIDNAKARDAKMLSDANSQVQTTLSGINSQIDNLRVHKGELEATVKELGDEVSSLVLEADTQEKRLAKVKEAIAKLTNA
jgi:chromosome segregation ATPase